MVRQESHTSRRRNSGQTAMTHSELEATLIRLLELLRPVLRDVLETFELTAKPTKDGDVKSPPQRSEMRRIEPLESLDIDALRKRILSEMHAGFSIGSQDFVSDFETLIESSMQNANSFVDSLAQLLNYVDSILASREMAEPPPEMD